MTTVFPPELKPVFGVIAVTAGGGTKVKPPTRVAVCPSTLVTRTSAGPAAPAGVVAVMDVAVMVPIVAETPANLTVALGVKFVPVMVTTVPPAVLPEVGLMEVIVGGRR